jgi:hypothetical protein
MSDGISDALRAGEESGHVEAFYMRFILALKEKCVTRADVITKLVDDADQGRMFRRQDDTLKKIQDLAASLVGKGKNKDERAWAQFIHKAMDALHHRDPKYIQALLKLSPFKKSAPMRVKYGYGFVNLGGYIEAAIAQRLNKEGKATYNADDYLVFIPQSVIDQVKIVWLEGPHGTPMVADQKKKDCRAA